MRRHRAAAVGLVIGLLLAGCGDGGETTAPTTTPTTTQQTTAPTTAQPTTTAPGGRDPAAEERARAANLQLSDFPEGWKLHEEGEGLDLELVWADVLRCLGVTPPEPAGSATSPTFLRGLATQAQSTVEYMSEPAANSTADTLANPRFEECATEAFNADAERNKPEGATPGPARVAPLDIPQLGQRRFATRANFSMNLADLQVPITQDLIVLFDGGTVIRMMFLNAGSPFPEDLQRSLMQTVFDRA